MKAAFLSFAGLVIGCTGSGTPLPESRLAINVAPLTLAGVTDVTYTLSVTAGAATVWSKTLTSSAYGDGKGSLAYVGPCDASSTTNVVHLTIDEIRAGATVLSDWRNPGELTQTATCVPSSDTPVSFGITIARSANQGFFDVAVSFADIFCSAKMDCLDSQGGPLTLLHDPADNVRKQTAVVAWACTAGPGADTYLYYDNLVLRCFDGANALIGAWPYDPSLGPGNVGPGAAPFVFQSAVYRSVQEDNGVASWNVAFGIDVNDLPGRCLIEASATASDGPLSNYTTSGVYPWVQWQVELSSGVDTLSCSRHPMDVANSGVKTVYAATPKSFAHSMRAQGQVMARRGAEACGDTISALQNQASFTTSPEGLTARIGNAQSPFYRLPANLNLEGCCGDPCCGTP